jgi:hypothetical protein
MQELTSEQYWDQYRPDILQIHDNKAEGIKEIGIVEVKYCRDTDPRPQRAAALEQHSLLLADMKRYHCTWMNWYRYYP